MASSDQQPDESSGVLLGDGEGVKASDLYDPATGRAMLVQGYPVDHAPPGPDSRRVGIIDSGVIPEHPQLRNLVVAMKDFTGGDDPVDRVGHGTVVAIKLVGSAASPVPQPADPNPGTGAGPGASPALVSAKVTGADGRIELAHVIEAVRWMATQDVLVVNMSLAFLGKAERYAPLCEAIAQCAETSNRGTMFVAAAGNFGPNVAAYPASCKVQNVISVGALLDSKPWAQSGRGDIVAESQTTIVRAYRFHGERAQELARAGSYEEARKEYAASLADEENAPAFFGLALLDFQAGDADAACAALTRAVALEPDNVEMQSHLGVAKLMQKRPAEAMPHFDRAIQLDPGNVRARTNRGLALMELGEPGKALDDLVAARGMVQDTSRIDAIITDLARRFDVGDPVRRG